MPAEETAIIVVFLETEVISSTTIVLSTVSGNHCVKNMVVQRSGVGGFSTPLDSHGLSVHLVIDTGGAGGQEKNKNKTTQLTSVDTNTLDNFRSESQTHLTWCEGPGLSVKQQCLLISSYEEHQNMNITKYNVSNKHEKPAPTEIKFQIRLFKEELNNSVSTYSQKICYLKSLINTVSSIL